MLRDLLLRLASGETLALVGPSGIGKIAMVFLKQTPRRGGQRATKSVSLQMFLRQRPMPFTASCPSASGGAELACAHFETRIVRSLIFSLATEQARNHKHPYSIVISSLWVSPVVPGILI